ncbi:hypothetical protein Hamer_G001082 [Homarus americanus]|uniref:Uncharacterized protein n=1 Tax=Homarus americanus TaxID=6706 RepID=A0A8J5N2Q6_HOMAM|nr:hypothetical protein Hamer_G001082 [Homarus americanus]
MVIFHSPAAAHAVKDRILLVGGGASATPGLHYNPRSGPGQTFEVRQTPQQLPPQGLTRGICPEKVD